ncbi:MAG: carboxypeptidase regulatory-like domain-containing protein [Candidatus Marinimicrobia bacterium]|nr:carboxypeptidase regulatory-like domain-containing protein [Candidatus Neomarinimicrobiota bacterium]
MVSNVTNKVGVMFIVVLAVMMLGLFTGVDSVVAAGNSGPQKVSERDAKNIEIAAKFDGQKWLELYKSNGWEKTKFSRLSLKAQTPIFKDMSQKLRTIHQRMLGDANRAKLSTQRRAILKPFRLSREVTSISIRGSIMKRAQFVAIGSTVLSLNGSNPDTITVGDSLVITVDLLGDTAFFDVFWDANDNQVVDAGDFSLFEDDEDAFVVDNGFEDENPAAGTIQITLYPFEDEEDVFLIVAESSWLITVNDGVGMVADTAALRVEADPSSFTVSGSVGTHEGVLILAFEGAVEETFEDGPESFALTISDASGNYTLDLPTESPGFWFIGAVDAFDVTGGLFPDPAGYFELVAGDVTMIDFNFISGDATITVSVQDNNGLALVGVPVTAFQDDGFGAEVFGTTNSIGIVDFAVVGGDWNVFAEPDWFNPNYLVPFTQYVNVPTGGFALVNLVAYNTDSFITGTTFLNLTATGGFEVRGTSQLGYTLTTSEAAGGTYSLPTSSFADLEMGNNGYCVAVCHLSENQFSPQDQYEIASDSVGVNLYVYTTQGAIEGFVLNLDNGEPVPFAGVDVYDVTGFVNFGGTDESGYYWIPVLNGTYTVEAFADGFEQAIVEGVVVLDNTVNVDFNLQPRTSGLPDVFSVRDFPDDQGRQVIVGWYGVSLDFADVTNYSLWRLDESEGGEVDTTFIKSIPDVNLHRYFRDAPTRGDFIPPSQFFPSTFLVIAHTEFDGFLMGSPGTGESVDNLIPEAPSLVGAANAAGIELSWTEIVEEEAKFYTVYRSVGDGAGFSPLANVTGTVYLDSEFSVRGTYVYYVTATDFSEQEGESSNEFSFLITGVDGFSGAIPKVFALDQNYPNPFNPTTRINYQLPVSGNVVVEVYNLKGEIVTTLVDGLMQAGFHSVEWNGLTSTGNQISSGVYLYRIQAGDFNKVRKMIMLK